MKHRSIIALCSSALMVFALSTPCTLAYATEDEKVAASEAASVEIRTEAEELPDGEAGIGGEDGLDVTGQPEGGQTPGTDGELTSSPDGDEGPERDTVPANADADEEDADDSQDGTEESKGQVPAPTLTASAHVQNLGWTDAEETADGTILVGTSGRGLRLEGMRLSVAGGSIEYKAHVQNVGWERTWSADGADSGSTGRSWRLEAVRIRLSDEMVADGWSVQYRAHAQDYGWLGWAADGEEAGTAGMSKRLEAIEIRVVRADEALPDEGDAPTRGVGLVADAHVQNVGWQPTKSGYSVTIGTMGRALRMEAMRISPSVDAQGSVVYSAHVQNEGWQHSRSNGEVAGSEGRGRRVEAITIALTGELEQRFDVWYRAYVQNVGWLDWAQNGQKAGSEGLNLRMESLEIRLVNKGAEQPGDSDYPMVDLISGSSELDIVLNNILRNEIELGPNALKNAFDYVTTFDFKHYPTPSPTQNWEVWSKDAAISIYKKKNGNCYCYAALFTWLAKALGYDSNVYIGRVKSSASGYSVHSWSEVKEDGIVYMCDPDLQKFLPDYDFYMRRYEEAPAYFYDSNGVALESTEQPEA